MKYFMFFIFCFFVTSFGFGDEFNFTENEYQIVSAYDEEINSDFLDFFLKLQEMNEEELVDFALQNWDPNLVVKFDAGLTIPFSMFIKGNFFSVSPESSMIFITLNKDLFVNIKDKILVFSDDLITWKSFFEFFSGKFGASAVYYDIEDVEEGSNDCVATVKEDEESDDCVATVKEDEESDDCVATVKDDEVSDDDCVATVKDDEVSDDDCVATVQEDAVIDNCVDAVQDDEVSDDCVATVQDDDEDDDCLVAVKLDLELNKR